MDDGGTLQRASHSVLYLIISGAPAPEGISALITACQAAGWRVAVFPHPLEPGLSTLPNSPGWFQRSVAEQAAAAPGAQLTMLGGYDHNAPPEVLTPILIDFFGANR